ncbi:collagen alpha-1(I) chain-like [Pithys albifrons albifrons]|uniref:collagen alpha-1(I) chain-like n=1 Tax=Pithys albifrons albifrons TaxID=3385563 RepID=UPI003A5D1B4D
MGSAGPAPQNGSRARGPRSAPPAPLRHRRAKGPRPQPGRPGSTRHRGRSPCRALTRSRRSPAGAAGGSAPAPGAGQWGDAPTRPGQAPPPPLHRLPPPPSPACARPTPTPPSRAAARARAPTLRAPGLGVRPPRPISARAPARARLPPPAPRALPRRAPPQRGGGQGALSAAPPRRGPARPGLSRSPHPPARHRGLGPAARTSSAGGGHQAGWDGAAPQGLTRSFPPSSSPARQAAGLQAAAERRPTKWSRPGPAPRRGTRAAAAPAPRSAPLPAPVPQGGQRDTGRGSPPAPAGLGLPPAIVRRAPRAGPAPPPRSPRRPPRTGGPGRRPPRARRAEPCRASPAGESLRVPAAWLSSPGSAAPGQPRSRPPSRRRAARTGPAPARSAGTGRHRRPPQTARPAAPRRAEAPSLPAMRAGVSAASRAGPGAAPRRRRTGTAGQARGGGQPGQRGDVAPGRCCPCRAGGRAGLPPPGVPLQGSARRCPDGPAPPARRCPLFPPTRPSQGRPCGSPGRAGAALPHAGLGPRAAALHTQTRSARCPALAAPRAQLSVLKRFSDSASRWHPGEAIRLSGKNQGHEQDMSQPGFPLGALCPWAHGTEHSHGGQGLYHLGSAAQAALGIPGHVHILLPPWHSPSGAPQRSARSRVVPVAGGQEWRGALRHAPHLLCHLCPRHGQRSQEGHCSSPSLPAEEQGNGIPAAAACSLPDVRHSEQRGRPCPAGLCLWGSPRTPRPRPPPPARLPAHAGAPLPVRPVAPEPPGTAGSLCRPRCPRSARTVPHGNGPVPALPDGMRIPGPAMAAPHGCDDAEGSAAPHRRLLLAPPGGVSRLAGGEPQSPGRRELCPRGSRGEGGAAARDRGCSTGALQGGDGRRGERGPRKKQRSPAQRAGGGGWGPWPWGWSTAGSVGERVKESRRAGGGLARPGERKEAEEERGVERIASCPKVPGLSSVTSRKEGGPPAPVCPPRAAAPTDREMGLRARGFPQHRRAGRRAAGWGHRSAAPPASLAPSAWCRVQAVQGLEPRPCHHGERTGEAA